MMIKRLINQQDLTRRLRQLSVLFALLLLPLGAWADYTYGGQSLTFYYSGESGPNYYYSGSESNQVTEWNVTTTGEYATYQASTFKYSGFEDLRLTYVKSLKGTISNFTFVGGINSSNFVNMKVYRLATQDATTRTLIGSVTIGGDIDNPTYTYVAENGVSQEFNYEYIQLAFERVSDVDQPTIYTTAINSITLTFNGTAYGLTVGGTIVTSDNYSNVLGDGKVSFTPANNAVSPATPATLTLNKIESSFTGTSANDAFIKCTGDITSLTVLLKGENELTLGDNNSSVFSGSAITFTKENESSSLKIIIPGNWTGNLYNNGTTAINATYNNHLYLDAGYATNDHYYTIKTLSCCTYSSYMGDEYLMFRLSGDQTTNTDEESHYSIDYVDKNLQDVDDAVFNVSGSALPLYGPCTLTYYTTSGGCQSEVSTAYYLGLSTNAVRTTLGTSVAPPTIVPAIGEDLELIINETTSSGVNPVYDSTSGLITTSSTVTGEATCSVKIYCTAATTLGINVLNSTDGQEKYELGDFTLTVREPGLFVAGVKVTTDNASEITSDNITEGTVSYDATENTLTLNAATITGQIICSYDALTVHLIGYNTITPGEGNSPFVYSNPGTGTLTFTTNENPNSSRLEANGVTSIAALGQGYTVNNTFETRTTVQGSEIGIGVEAEDGWKVVIFKDDLNSPDHTTIWNFKNYNLFIGGTRVTSDNLQGNGYIAYNPDTHTLPISGATQYAVKSGLEELIIEVNGVATIDASGYSDPDYYMPAISFESMTGGPNSGTLKFVKAADADLASITLIPSDTHKAIEGFAVDNIIITEPLQLKSPASMSDILNATTVTIGNHEVYGIKVAGITVTDGNKDNILGDDLTEEGSVASVSYNPETYTLTLNNATIDMSEKYEYPIESTVKNLVLDLKGESNITVNSVYACAYKYTGTSQSATLSLNQEAVGGATLSISGVGYLANTYDGCTFNETWNGNSDKTGWRYVESNGANLKVTITFLQYYDMWVNGYQLTSDNIGAMDSNCRFMPETHTLKLDKYPNNGEFVSGLPELIVELSGQNNVKSFTYEGDGNGTLIFRVADNASANIEIENVDNSSNTPVYGPAISDFNTVTVESPLKLLTPQEAPENWSAYTNKVVIGINSYDLYVDGVLVREDNASNVLGDDLTEEGSVASVSYDATSNTLTLNGASIIPDHETAGIVYYGEDDLTIKLIGTENTVKGGERCTAIAYYNYAQLETPPTLTFTKGDNSQACSLLLEAQGETVIDAFTNISHNGLYMLEDSREEDETLISTTTFTTTLLAGGTGTSDAPFLIKTKEDLADFAKYVNSGVITTEYVKLDNDINCSGLTGFTPIGTSDYPFIGTFTNSDNYTISNLNCTAAGYIGLFGVFGINGDKPVAGSISGLILDNCSFSGGSVGGAIAGYLRNGTISHCMVTNSSVTTNSGLARTSAGIVGESYGTITNCTVSSCTITASTTVGSYSTTAGGIVGTNGGTISSCEVTGTDEQHKTLISSINNDDGSDPYRQAGGIVGDCVNDNGLTITISGNSVNGVTTVRCEDSDGAAQAGAIIGRRNNNNITLTNNFYEYTVKTIIINGDDEDERTGYAQRGVGDFVYDGENHTNVYTDINGAVMNTKKVTLPAETAQGAVVGEEYYSVVDDGILVAPGQTATLNVMPGQGYFIVALTVTNTTTEAAISTTSTALGDNITRYTFEMPDAPVTVTLTTAAAMTVNFGNNTWATICSEYDMAVPNGTKAYAVSSIGETAVNVTEIGYIPQGKGVLLELQKEASSTVTIGSLYTGDQAVTTTGLLGTTAETAVSGISGTVYVLYNDNFVRATGGNIPANRGYLTIPDEVAPAGARLSIKIDDALTRIHSMYNEQGAMNQGVYNLNGQRVSNPTKGLYIINGKKVIKK